MRTTFHIATAFAALLAAAAPAAAQQPEVSATPPATVAVAPADAAKTEEEKILESWKKGREIPIQYLPRARPPRPQRLRNDEGRRRGVQGLQAGLGAAFTSQVQNLRHRNTALPVVVNNVNTNQLQTIGFGFNNSTANLYLNAQLAPGIRVALTTYLSSRHHNETWVKDGYLQIDESPIDFVPLKALMQIVTIRAGHFEINYGDAHFRRSDNGNAIYNPFVGNYILDAFTTEIGGGSVPEGPRRRRDGGDHRRRDSRHGAHSGPAGPRVHREARHGPAGQQGPAPPGDRLDVYGRQSVEQHAVWRRSRRLALLLGHGEHGGDRERAVHVGPDQSRAPQ